MELLAAYCALPLLAALLCHTGSFGRSQHVFKANCKQIRVDECQVAFSNLHDTRSQLITEFLGLEGPREIIQSNPPSKAGSPGVGDTGMCPGSQDVLIDFGCFRGGRMMPSSLKAHMLHSDRQCYEELERQLKEVYKERSNILQLLKTSKELQGLKVNLQSLKNDEASTKTDVQKLLELGQNQREMKSLQEAFQKQLNEASEKAEKQQATINFLKTEMERKSKIIRDLQNENKSLKNKLLSGNKLCGIHAEESKKIQSQLKELRYGKKDLIFKVWKNVSAEKENFHVALRKEENQGTQECDSQDVAKTCLGNRNDSKPRLKAAEAETSFQELHSPPWTKPEDKKPPEKKEKKYKESDEEANPAEEEDEEVWEDGDNGHRRLGEAQLQG
ncbi:hypothetical protein DUI87_25645 [Hirundo rustica rustica]|uniref:Uncharacterized protein n=1 Tax=Hirundo rustica rustica TaxID=333673 RepID=A0A3M0JBH8_HIRRU|nr:hypothetical protein DUI87_25645 [Hirundo rustica rustica]